jgi:type IV pilus secretin PilQ/predicted competence protein
MMKMAGINKWLISGLVGVFLFSSGGMNCLSQEPATNSTDPLSGKMLVTVDYKDANLSTVLQSLSYSYNLNIVASKDVRGKITVSLWDVTIDEALEAILSVNGYTFARKGNIIYVTPGSGMEGVDMITEVIGLKYISAAETAIILEKVLSSKGDVRINEVNNSLVITDFPVFIKRVKVALEDIDVPPIQVLIEARLIDITEKDFQNFGVTYSIDYKPEGMVKGLFDRSTQFQEEAAGTSTVAGPSSTLTGGQLKITAFTLKGLSGSATVDALIQDQKAHLLASPSIMTLNGKEARIIIGERYPYKEKTQTTTGTTETTKFVDIGTTLRVTPWVSPDGSIIMNVHPEVSSLTASLDAGPRIATREADATIMVQDGDTIVIGGLIKRQDDSVDGGVPFLKDIPFLGKIFSQTSVDAQQTELVVFITPHIITKKQERKSIQGAAPENVFVEIETKGEDLLVNTLWEEARNYEKNEGIESRRKDKDRRMGEALENYEQIVSQFPDHPLAPEALYRMGIIFYEYYKNLQGARIMFSQLEDYYQENPLAKKARKKIDQIDRKLDVGY